jgi:hypothetical protein
MINFLDISLIIILVIVIGLIGVIIYLIYLPFKKRLIKSGKLTEKLNRQINRTFILILCLLVIVLYFFKDYRTPSNDRLEKISDIYLPADFKVLKDEYQDMMQDYCILYDIKLDKNATTELIKNIKSSKFYNKNSFHKGVWTENDFIAVDSVKAVWSKSPTGFDFSRQDGLTSYSIELDTLTNILKYNECAD